MDVGQGTRHVVQVTSASELLASQHAHFHPLDAGTGDGAKEKPLGALIASFDTSLKAKPEEEVDSSEELVA